MSWLEQLELQLDQLDQRLADLLRSSSTTQEQLFREQRNCDRVQALQRQRQQLQQSAEHQRKQLLQLAEDVNTWRHRLDRARQANATELASRADQYLHRLMERGRQLWNDFDDLGRRFREVEQQLLDLQTQQKAPGSSDLDKDWALFYAELELQKLREDSGL
ncbi:hercynine metabolism protein [Synechococcus sp. M16CYN]|uniref:hercynine metabolism protein n=1 Tax=Synechococcus sp. M16CYN TaxID=3103139 RepID=UPI003243766D